ncbi:hypothetical protein PVIIG_06212 [Plasmodium vivax India VII]|uniref:VIR protein n=1 Tax=Plasmodium vivax India VII TaxID=1077284 RepID=A0A0J9SIY7_PLAVI|nr:hypothetical protein PVIIG_06212 [Plasmodium vivax India VII]
MSKYLSKYDCNIIYPIIEHDELIIKKKISLYSEILYWIVNAYSTILYIGDSRLYDQYLGECFKVYKEIMCNDVSNIKKNYKKELQEFRNNFNKAITFLKENKNSILQNDIPSEDVLVCNTESPKAQGVGEDENVEIEGNLQPRVKEATPGPSGERGSPETPGPKGIAKSEYEKPGTTQSGDKEEGPIVQARAEGSTVPKAPQRLHPEGGNNLMDDVTMDIGIAGETSKSIMPKKYTPLGSWVSTRILGRNKLMENMKKNNYELLLNDVGNHEASLNDPMYHIRYNSATKH